MKEEPLFEITDKASNIQILKDVASNLISTLSGSMFNFALGLMLLNNTHSPLSFGLEMIIMPIVNMLFVIPVGNLVDTYPHKKIIVLSLILRLIALASLVMVIDFFHNDALFIPIIVFVFINSITNLVNTTTYSAAIHELVNVGKIQTLSSYTQAASALSSIVAPALGMALYAIFGFRWMIVFEIGATSVSLLIIMSMRFFYVKQKKIKKDGSQKKQLENFKVGINYIKQQKLILEMITIGVFVNFFFTALSIGMPYIISDQLHLGNAPISYLESGNALGMLIGSLLVGTFLKKVSFKNKMISSLLVTIFSVMLLGILFAFSINVFVISTVGTLIMMILGCSIIVLNIITQVFLQMKVPSEILGRVMSTIITINTSAMPIGTLIFTIIFEKVNSGASVLIICAVIMLVYVLWRIPTIIKIAPENE
ncbi:MFS transporter [Ligilactobacillus sp. WILCCON 0076]|uniref:MFS transporter n=1 Tax=Ligilactobacillus ubinensis TaxID=2876789 RepID=A0A9X2FLT1_9LACO|nr:MFS transporter [Ligilactobacillus ubinensis]MCP0887061.1 MFS transporter [Ligilactobacillus ubinensis]